MSIRIPSVDKYWTHARVPKDMEVLPCERWLVSWFPVVATPANRMVEEGEVAFIEYSDEWGSIRPGKIYKVDQVHEEGNLP